MASRYFRNTGDNNWATTTNWSATDGGVSVGAIPTSVDDVFFTVNSSAIGQITVPVTIKSLTCSKGTSGTHLSIQVSPSGTKIALTVTGSCNVGYTDFTDINASGGITIWTYQGVVSNCNNINPFTDVLLQVNTTAASSLIIY